MQEIGIWSGDKKGYRNLVEMSESDFASKFAGQSLSGIVEEVHPFKAIVHFSKEGIIMPITFSDIQVISKG